MSGSVTNTQRGEGEVYTYAPVPSCVWRYAKQIRAKHPEQRIYVVDRIVRLESRSEPNLILEVMSDRFERFQQRCSEQNIHWLVETSETSRRVVKPRFMTGYPTVSIRTQAALDILGSEDNWCDAFGMALAVGWPAEYINVSAMPQGWWKGEKSSVLRMSLQRDLPQEQKYNNFVESIARQAKVVFV